MPAVRALMSLTAVAEHGELVRSNPAQEEIETFQGREVSGWIVSTHEEEDVATSAQSVMDVVSVEVVAIDPRGATAGDDGVPGEPEDEPAEEPAEEPTPEPKVAEAAAPDQPAAPEHPTGGAGANSPAKTVRVDAERLDALMHSMGELVIHRTAVQALTAGLEIPELQQAVQDLTRSSQALQAMVMQVRMIPVDIVFLRFPRLVRDLSTKLGKDVELKLVGKETELDRTVVDALGDPLVHLCATRSITGSSIRMSVRRPASRASGPSRSPPATPVEASSSRFATTVTGSIPRRSLARRSRRA